MAGQCILSSFIATQGPYSDNTFRHPETYQSLQINLSGHCKRSGTLFCAGIKTWQLVAAAQILQVRLK